MNREINSGTDSRMGSEPVFGLIFKMALPSMFSMLIHAMYNIVDSIFVSRISETALSAVSLVFPVMMLNAAVGVGTGIGLSSLISRRLGAGMRHEAQDAANHGMFLALCSWTVFAIFGIFGSEAFATAFSNEPDLIVPAAAYCKIVNIGSLFVFVSLHGERIMQGCGNMIAPMLCQLAGAVTNVILDPIFIFGCFGMPAMGVAGAAYATVIGELVSMLLVLRFILGDKLPIQVDMKGFRPRIPTIKSIYAVAFPSMMMQSIASLTILILNAILIGFSETAVAVLGVYFKFQSFIFMPVFGLNQGTMPIMGYNYGAGNRKRLLEAYRYALITACAILTLGTLLFQIAPELLMSLFNAEGEMMKMGVRALKTISMCFPFAAFGIITSTLFQSCGYGFYSLIISTLRQLILIVPLAFIFSRIWGVSGVWTAYPTAEAVAATLSFIMFRRLMRREINRLGK